MLLSTDSRSGPPCAPTAAAMKILWIDPINSDPQFLNALALALAKEGHQVIVRSNRRRGYDPPRNISWSDFTFARTLPQSLENKRAWRLAIAATYLADWARAIRIAGSCGVHSVLISTNLALPRIDAWAMRRLRDSRILPVVIVHKPYRDFFQHSNESHSNRYRNFYNRVSRILVMTKYTRTILKQLYGLPESRFAIFPHPHFSDLLSDVPVSLPLRNSLEGWAGSHPVLSFFSNHSAEHGLETLLAALPLIRSLVSDMRILFVSPLGNRAITATIERKIDEAGCRGNCLFRWTSYSYSELLAYLGITTAVVIPYDHATQSGVIALAAGFGIPVVATTVGGLPEMVLPNETGELIPPRDPRALAEAVARVVATETQSVYRTRTREFARTFLAPSRAAAIVSESLREAGARALRGDSR